MNIDTPRGLRLSQRDPAQACIADPFGVRVSSCMALTSEGTNQWGAGHRLRPRAPAIMNGSAKDHYGMMMSGFFDSQSTPRQIAVTPGRKDRRMEAKARFTIEIVSDIV